jgi:hypothetical protein
MSGIFPDIFGLCGEIKHRISVRRYRGYCVARVHNKALPFPCQCRCPGVHVSMRPCVQPSMCSDVRASRRSCVQAFVRPHVHAFTWSCVHMVMRPHGQASMRPHVYMSACPHVRMSACPHVRMSTCPRWYSCPCYYLFRITYEAMIEKWYFYTALCPT